MWAGRCPATCGSSSMPRKRSAAQPAAVHAGAPGAVRGGCRHRQRFPDARLLHPARLFAARHRQSRSDLRSASGDLHAGQFGGAIPSAARSLARLLTALHDEDGRVTVPGFYEGVDELSAEDRALYARAPFDEAEWLGTIGVKGTEGEKGFSTLERTWIRPTLEINGMFSGHTAAGMKAIVPSQATAKISCRVVAHQDPVGCRNASPSTCAVSRRQCRMHRHAGEHRAARRPHPRW